MYFTLLSSCDNLIIIKYIIMLCTHKGGDILNKEMLKGTIDILILSVLSKGDNYGYEISRIIKMKTEGAFEILEATMYLALKRLENQKAIDFYWGDESGGGRRKYFKITELGKEQLSQLINDWKETVQIVGIFI
jgi:PadR family transcriptional regulator, regulatory protein PadR